MVRVSSNAIAHTAFSVHLPECITMIKPLLGVKKKLKAAAKSKGCESIKPWIQSITNHLYWVAAMGQGDEELTLSMWRSLLNHICNIHHGHEGPYTECLHGPLEDRDWMSRGVSFYI